MATMRFLFPEHLSRAGKGKRRENGYDFWERAATRKSNKVFRVIERESRFEEKIQLNILSLQKTGVPTEGDNN